MTEIEPPVEPTVEWWAYGGIRVLYSGRMLAWLTESGDGEEVLFEPRRRGGSFTVGLLYPVLVTRRDGRTRMHGSPGKAHGRVDATLAALLRAEHYTAQARLAARPRDRRGLPIPPVNLHPDPATGRPVVDFTTINTTISKDLADHRRCSLCGERIGYWVNRAELRWTQQVIG